MRAIRIFDDGDGTVTVQRDNSLNTLAPMAANELARINIDTDPIPAYPDGVDRKYWAWDGANVVEASPAVKDAIDAADTAAVAEQHDAASPNNGWGTFSKRERFLVRCIYRLAKLHYPALTLAQFRAQLRTEWDATPEAEA